MREMTNQAATQATTNARTTFLTGPDAGAGQRPARSVPRFSRGIAIVVVVLLGTRGEIALGLTVGYAAAIVCAPLWLFTLTRYRGAVLLVLVGVVAVGSGFWLSALAAPTHVIALGELAGNTVGIVGIVCSFGFLLWARSVLPDGWIALLFGLGLVASVSTDNERFSENPWRFGFSFAVTVVVLAVAHIVNRRWFDLLAVLALTAVSVATDARSSFAILCVTAILVAWQMRPTSSLRSRKYRSGAAVILAMGVLAALVYNLGQAAIVAGLFGEATRERTVAQITTAGSLILGGRPELAATSSLMAHQPYGFGAGTLLNPSEVLVAKMGMTSINYAPNNGYVENYMFGGTIELHSVLGDLWARFGIPGCVLAAVMLCVVLSGVGKAVAANRASGLVLFLAVNTVWVFFFGPLYTATRLLILAVALAAIPKDAMRSKLDPGRMAGRDFHRGPATQT